MKTMNEIKTTYKGLGAIHTLDKALKKTKGMSLLDVLIVDMAYHSDDFIRKTEIEKQLKVSPAMTQKSTKYLRKEGFIIKDRDIEDEGIIIIGMNNEMRKKAEQLFAEVEKTQQDILNGNNPADKANKEKKTDNPNNSHEQNDNEQKHENKPNHNDSLKPNHH